MSKYDDRLPIPLPGALKRDLLLPRLPFWGLALILIGIAASFVPLTALLYKRSVLRDAEPIHFIQDMDNQPKVKAQATSPVYADKRGNRLPVPNTVSRAVGGNPAEISADERARVMDDHYRYGVVYVNGQGRWANQLPEQIEVNQRLLERGRVMFDVNCAVCHGLDGQGQGPVYQRAVELQQVQFVQPSNLLALNNDKTLTYWSKDNSDPANNVDGRIYNVIRNGIRSMPGYGAQIDIEDRWAIVAYIRAMQMSVTASEQDLTEEEAKTLIPLRKQQIEEARRKAAEEAAKAASEQANDNEEETGQ